MMNPRNLRFPFTASQWQELEQQALVYKYMASGIPIPPDLLFTIRRSYLHSSLSAGLLSHHPQHVGWNYLQMSLGRKIDVEPGRCRRTDGKKWRCSKEAYTDSKYCERHMHRGKNRSRKPVEVLKTPSSNTNPSITENPSTVFTPTTHSVSSSTSSETHHRHQHHSCNTNTSPRAHLSFLNHNNTNANESHRPSGNTSSLSFPDNSNSLFLDSSAAYPHSCSDYRNRYVYGMKEEVDEHAFFSEPSGAFRNLSASTGDESWQFTPMTVSSSSSKQRSCSGIKEYSYLELQSQCDSTKQEDRSQRNCYGLSNDFKCEIPMRLGNEEPQKTMHRFFDELPHKGRDSWLDLDDKASNSSSVSTTKLSISIPTSHDFPSL